MPEDCTTQDNVEWFYDRIHELEAKNKILRVLNSALRSEIKRLRQFIQDEYDRYHSCHPYAGELRRTYPWLEKTAEPEEE